MFPFNQSERSIIRHFQADALEEFPKPKRDRWRSWVCPRSHLAGLQFLAFVEGGYENRWHVLRLKALTNVLFFALNVAAKYLQKADDLLVFVSGTVLTQKEANVVPNSVEHIRIGENTEAGIRE